MRSLRKNQQSIWYSLYCGKVPEYVTDSDGNVLVDPVTTKKVRSGNYIQSYSMPLKIDINVSEGRGDSEMDYFGANVIYDRVLTTTDLKLPITETTLIWIETEPMYKSDGTVDDKSADYVVSGIPIKSLNSIQIPIRNRRKVGVEIE